MSQTVDRALAIIDALEVGPMSLEDVAELLDVHKSTGLRLLQTLEARRFVVKDDRHRYRLGSRLISLGQNVLNGLEIRRDAAPFLEQLNHEYGHTVHLAHWEDDQVVYIDKREGRESLRLYSQVGKPAPLHCTGVAKVLMAGLSDEQLDPILKSLDLPRHTENTITDPIAFRAELDRVRERGYAVDDREHEEFANCIAVPVRDSSDHVIAAISITTPSVVRDVTSLLEVLPSLRSTAAALSQVYGWSDIESVGQRKNAGAGRR